MKLITSLLLILTSFCSYAEQKHLIGVVKTTEGIPIEYCLVNISSTNNYTYTNEKGEYSLYYNEDSATSIRFYCLGYETLVYNISKVPGQVMLKTKQHELSTVEVSAVALKHKWKRGVMGKSNLKPYGIATGNIGQEVAIFLERETNNKGYLDRIYFYVTSDGEPSAKFRVHVYDVDTSSLPGAELLDTSIIIHATKGNEWVYADVSNLKIPAQGMFISMEWIGGYGNTGDFYNSKKYSGQPDFQGQVLGMSNGYFRRGSLYYSRFVNTKWGYWVLAGSSRRNVLNPMIYATYKYCVD